MAYAGKCDRCGGFYDLPFEHGTAIRARIVDVFIPLEVNQKQLDESVYKIKLNTIDTILIMSCMVLRDEFDFGQKRLDRFCERFNSKTEAICDGDIIWDDLIQTLKEETGLDFTIRENK